MCCEDFGETAVVSQLVQRETAHAKGSWTTWRCATWLKIVGVHRALGNLNLCSRLSPDRIILSIWCLDRSKNFWETWRWTLMSWYPRRQPSKRLSQMGGAFCKLWPLAVWTIRFLPFYIPQFGMKFPNPKRAMYTYRNVQNIYQHLSQTWPTCGDHSPVHDMEHTEMHYHSPHVSPQIWIPASNEVHLVQHPEEFQTFASHESCFWNFLFARSKIALPIWTASVVFGRTIAGQPDCAH